MIQNTHSNKTQENKSKAVANNMPKGGDRTMQFEAFRPEQIAQDNLQQLANNSQQTKQLQSWQSIANATPPVQKKANNTGLPDNLKSGIENLSGFSMDDVKVHYNSDKPTQLQAHAYAKGSEIHIGPSQEKHLPHEAWHVVQQKQGRVQPTMQMKGNVQVNDDKGLEREADMMGKKAYSVFQNKSKIRMNAQTVYQGYSELSHENPLQTESFPPLQKQSKSSNKMIQGNGNFNNNVQFVKTGRDDGKFIGDRSQIHIHYDIGSPHLFIPSIGKFDIGGTDLGGGSYSTDRLNEALNNLLEIVTSNNNGPLKKFRFEAVSGFENCFEWLCDTIGYDKNTEKDERFRLDLILEELNERDRKFGRRSI